MKKRQLTKRHIKILALQRCSKAISLVVQNGLYMPDELTTMSQLEIDIECNEIAYQLRKRLSHLSVREWPQIEQDIYESSDSLNLRKEPNWKP